MCSATVSPGINSLARIRSLTRQASEAATQGKAKGRSEVNKLFYGDNLQILREHIKDESVDLIYLDPPFNSNANYNVLFRSPAGEKSHAQIEAFEDTWHWNETATTAFDEVM